MNLPNGAKPIVDVRLKGLKPDEMIIVSLIGQTGEANYTVYANEKAEYDWRWLRGLKVCLYVNSTSNWKPLIASMARHFPEWLGVYNADQFKGATASLLPRVEDIEKAQSLWRWKLDFLPWTSYQNELFAWGD